MLYGQLGGTGTRVSRVVLGAATFGELSDDRQVQTLIDQAMEVGINAIDTGDIYAQGASEEAIGKAIGRHRGRLLVFTKVGLRVGDTVEQLAMAGRLDEWHRWRDEGVSPNDAGLSRVHIRQAIDASLRRLRVDHIDLYQVHRFDTRTPLEETLRTLDDLVRSGKIRYIGCSAFASWQLVQSLWMSDRLGLESFVTTQVPYNLLARRPELELLPAAKTHGVGVLAYQPLAGGMLTGRYDEARGPEEGSRFAVRPMYRSRYWQPEVFSAVERLRAVAEQTGRTMPELAIGWVLANTAVSAVLVGAERPDEVVANAAVADRPLSEEELTAVAAAATP
jgi:1-deoxyxylulose-5-phosphate synthase